MRGGAGHALALLFLVFAGCDAASLRGVLRAEDLAHALGQPLFRLSDALEGAGAEPQLQPAVRRRLGGGASIGAAQWTAFKTDESSACSLPKTTSHSLTERCSWYGSCLEQNIPCGDAGYALSYGKKYCDRFVAQSYTSSKTAAWRDATLTCLQRSLAQSVANPKPASCNAIADDAFAQHVTCYTQQQASICDICSDSADDLLQIFTTVDIPEYKDPRSWKAAYGVLKTCVPVLAPGGVPSEKAARCAANIQKLSRRVALEQVGYLAEELGARVAAACAGNTACTSLMPYAEKLGEFVMSGGEEVYSLDVSGLPFASRLISTAGWTVPPAAECAGRWCVRGPASRYPLAPRPP